MSNASETTGQQQHVTAELRRWVAEQSRNGLAPPTLLRAMLDAGWAHGVAVSALDASAPGSPSVATAGEGSAAQRQSPARPMPQPLPDDGTYRLQAPDRAVQVLLSLHDPRLVVFGGLLSDDECDEMVALAAARLSRSETVQLDTGDSEVNDARTSDGMFFGREENALCARVEARIAAVLNWPLDHGEGLQVLRYRPGTEYRPHYDYFDPAQPGTAAVLRRGGQRVGTLIAYLNTPERGGATVFPDLGLDVAPVKGNAVFFGYDRADPSTRTLHGGARLLAGEKWVATKWLREDVFV